MKFPFPSVAMLAAFFAAGPADADALEGRKGMSEILAAAGDSDWRALDQENLLYLTLDEGLVIIQLSDSLAQRHTAQMRRLARENFYDGLSFYRVIDGFVAQGGDVLEKRSVKTAAPALKAEFDDPFRDDIAFDPLPAPVTVADGYAQDVGFIGGIPSGRDGEEERYWHLHCTGAVAMARNTEKDTGGTEFYIALQPQRYLDRNLSVFGRVVHGMEHVQRLRRVEPAQDEGDDLGETIQTVRVGADLPEEEQRQFRTFRSDRPVFRDYVGARMNRPEAFFYHRPDHVDICQLPYPVEALTGEAG